MSPTPPPNWHTIRDHWRASRGDDGVTIPPPPEPWASPPPSKNKVGRQITILVCTQCVLAGVLAVMIFRALNVASCSPPIHVTSFKEAQNLQR